MSNLSNGGRELPLRVDAPIQARLGRNCRKKVATFVGQCNEAAPAQQATPVAKTNTQETETKMSEPNITNNYYGDHGHGHGHDHEYDHHIHHHKPYTEPVREVPAASTDLTKGVLRIGGKSYDLIKSVLGSADFQMQFTGWLNDLLMRDRNVQYAIASVVAEAQKNQDSGVEANAAKIDANTEGYKAADAAIHKILKCAYFEDGKIMFPGLYMECGAVASIEVPGARMASFKEDCGKYYLTVDEVTVELPIVDIIMSHINDALKYAMASLPDVVSAEKILNFLVEQDDRCEPIAKASAEMVAEYIVSTAIPQLCADGKIPMLEDVVSSVLGFGASCAEFGRTSLSNLLAQLNALLPLAAPGALPIELRGFAGGNGTDEQRYPVNIRRLEVVSNNGNISMTGDTTAGMRSSTVCIEAPETGWYQVNGFFTGFMTLDQGPDPQLNSGYADRRLHLEVNGSDVIFQGDLVHFAESSLYVPFSKNVSTTVFLNAGDNVCGYVYVAGAGVVTIDTPASGLSVGLLPVSNVAIDINEAL